MMSPFDSIIQFACSHSFQLVSSVDAASAYRLEHTSCAQTFIQSESSRVLVCRGEKSTSYITIDVLNVGVTSCCTCDRVGGELFES